MINVKLFLKTVFITFVLLSLCEARGGRRGGSFGGLFGSWRKYKKPSNGGGNSRRIVSSSPVHTPITKAWHDNKKSNNNDKFQNYRMNGYNTPPLPAGGSFYQALPGNAIYVAQAPPREAAFGDYLHGFLVGRLLTMGSLSSNYHITHVYKEPPRASVNAAGLNNTSTNMSQNAQHETITEKVFTTPLVEFSTTTDYSKMLESNTISTENPLVTTIPPVPPYGVICIPLFVDETYKNGDVIYNERTICYPAPATSPQNRLKSTSVEIAGDIIEH